MSLFLIKRTTTEKIEPKEKRRAKNNTYIVIKKQAVFLKNGEQKKTRTNIR
jgi:hypothetical protein